MRLVGYSPDQATPLIVDKWRSDILLFKLKSGEYSTGFYQYWDDSDGNEWRLSGADAYAIDAQDIEWWVSAHDINELVEVDK